jgi:hypothetical protein
MIQEIIEKKTNLMASRLFLKVSGTKLLGIVVAQMFSTSF